MCEPQVCEPQVCEPQVCEPQAGRETVAIMVRQQVCCLLFADNNYADHISALPMRKPMRKPWQPADACR